MNKKLLHDKVFILVSALMVSLLGYHFVSNAVDFSLLSIDKITNSTDSFPQSGNGESIYGSFSDDNNYIVFKSSSSNLVSGDTNGVDDIFVKNLNTSVIERVSVSSAGVEGNNTSSESGISSDGRYIAFSSSSSNLVAGDTNASHDIFVHDRNTDTTERVSIATGGAESNADSYGASISANGRYVYFYSSATNLVAGDTNGFTDVFVHDRDLDTTERLSLSTAGVESDGHSYVFRSASSFDGRYVVFYSAGTTLVAGDTNGDIDIFIRDTQLDTTERVSVSSSEVEADNESFTPYITPDGRYVVFSSSATNLVAGDTNASYDAFIRDLQDGTTERVS
ncbi:MAG: TolB protein, partial [Patescibacteria group bacterium]|nr:TolB protein [Patescibacteria group bacterium]